MSLCPNVGTDPRHLYGVMLKNSSLGLLCLALISGAAHAQQFDRTMLDGVWAESADYQFGCRPDNLHQRLELSRDGKQLFFKNDRKWKMDSGAEIEEYSASVVRATKNVLVIRYGPELAGIPSEFREWEMRFIGPGTYLWRATSWPENRFNSVIGVKCQ